jgi:hypothetical protein
MDIITLFFAGGGIAAGLILAAAAVRLLVGKNWTV